MNMLAMQRRLDLLGRELDSIHGTLERVAAAVATLAPGGAPPDGPAQIALRMVEARRVRTEMLGGDLFFDPAWDMLLALFMAGEKGEALSVSRLCTASAVPQTTALRWLACLEDARLITRGPDGRDARRTRIALSPKAAEAMRRLLVRMRDTLCAPPPQG
jgi:DNA-binding MarR family transcriptional regulator